MKNLSTFDKLTILSKYIDTEIRIFDVVNEQAVSVSSHLEGVDIRATEVIADCSRYSPDMIKLILRPLSSLTEEHALEVAKIHEQPDSGTKWEIIDSNKSCVHLHLIKSSVGTIMKKIWVYKNPAEPVFEVTDESGDQMIAHNIGVAHQYLMERGYALALFIRTGHIDNGKTALELDMAVEEKQTIEKTETNGY